MSWEKIKGWNMEIKGPELNMSGGRGSLVTFSNKQGRCLGRSAKDRNTHVEAREEKLFSITLALLLA